MAAQVTRFSPQGTVKQVRQASAAFSEPMVAFGDPAAADPFDVTCPVPGQGRWVDTGQWVYDFERDLPAGIRCAFRLRAGLATLGAASAGDIFCNNQGHDCSDRWSPGATLIRTSAGQQAPGAPPAPSSTSTTPTDAGANARLGLDATRSAVQKDVGAARAEQCKQAKEKYQKAVEARRGACRSRFWGRGRPCLEVSALILSRVRGRALG